MEYVKCMDTSLTVAQIQLALHDSGLWNKRSDIMVPNLSWGLLPYEADFVVLSKSGFLTEVEIKRSWADFKRDFGKAHHHDDERIYHFYYCVPASIISKVKDFLKDRVRGELVSQYGNDMEVDSILHDRHPRLPAILTFNESGKVESAGFGYSGAYRSNCRKLFIEEQLQVARLGCLRYWNQQQQFASLPENPSRI